MCTFQHKACTILRKACTIAYQKSKKCARFLFFCPGCAQSTHMESVHILCVRTPWVVARVVLPHFKKAAPASWLYRQNTHVFATGVCPLAAKMPAADNDQSQRREFLAARTTMGVRRWGCHWTRCAHWCCRQLGRIVARQRWHCRTWCTATRNKG